MKRLLGFLAAAVAITALLTLTGRLVLPGRYGPEAVAAVYWSCAIVLFGSVVGVLPLVLGGPPSPREDGPAAATRFLASMLVRLGSVALGAAVAVVLGAVSLEPFLIWLGASYLLLLVVDTVFVFTASRSL
ncbi:MAG: hypothetical protein ACE5GX_05815 [Thermoanaerobaculia bacterium]